MGVHATTDFVPDFATDGAELFAGAGDAALGLVEAALAHLPADEAGIRLHGLSPLRPLLSAEGPIGAVAARIIGPAARPVRAILFDKNPAMNWSLGWHQDRTICVRERHDVAGFGPWTRKAGMTHVGRCSQMVGTYISAAPGK